MKSDNQIPNGLPGIQDRLKLQEVKDDSFLRLLEKNRSGGYNGLESHLDLFRRLHGYHAGRYYLIGAHPNVGKTQFTDFSFVFTAWLHAKLEGKQIKILYYSLELSGLMKKAKWCCLYLDWKYGIQWTADYVLGRIPKNPPSDAHTEYIKEAYQFVELMLQDVCVLDKPYSPREIYESVVGYYENYGRVLRAVSTDPKVPGQVRSFEQTREVPLTFLVIDHLALLRGPNKSTMDDMSELAVELRNTFEISPVFVQQFNQDLMKSRRESLTKLGEKKATAILCPQQLDFGDSTYTYRDADYVMGLVKPFKFQVEQFEGFPCTPPNMGGLGDSLLVAFLLKNRYGAVNYSYPMFMNGITGMFYDLPAEYEPDLRPWISLALKIVQHG